MPVKRWQNFDLKNLSNKSEFQSELEIPRNSMGHKMTLFRRINNVIIYSHKEKDIDSGLKQFIYLTLEVVGMFSNHQRDQNTDKVLYGLIYKMYS